jgi:23S rRNA G2069 N7-methylase RlmK/C1962 C5-methylase RlmI
VIELDPAIQAKITRQAEMLGGRVAKNQRRLAAAFAREHIGAYRLYDRDIPEIRAVVDWYEGHLVVGEYARTQTDLLPGWLEAIAQGAARALGVPAAQVHVRKRRTRPAEGDRYPGADARADEGQRLLVHERDLQLWCNLDDYLDTGLFPDHRETRRLVAKEAAGKRVLNLYGYTGSFTCAAARGGATSSMTVDASRNYLAWARDNMILNGVDTPAHQLQRGEVGEFLARSRGKSEWDLAILDPPSFSDRGELELLRDHRFLIESTLAVLAPGGVLWFSTNHQRFEPDLDGLGAVELTERTVPIDYRNRQVHRVWRIPR